MSKAKRTALGPKKRFAIFHRDGFTCQYCGRRPPEVCLEVDHVIAIANGGGNDALNLTTSCFDCNRGKSSSDLETAPETVSARIEREKELQKQVKALNALLSAKNKQEDEYTDALGTYWCDLHNPPKDHGKYIVSRVRAMSIKQFIKQLPTEAVREAMEIAHARKVASPRSDFETWKYFCGICWNKIKGK